MEAMSVERLLLAAWEEEGFIGKTRVPVGSSDLDVLAVNLNTKAVRVGESKVREGSQRVYLVDDWCASEMRKPGADFRWWLDESWAQWLNTLPKLWDNCGNPAVPWLFPVAHVDRIEVVFSCNLHVFTADVGGVNEALGLAAASRFRENPALEARMNSGLVVQGRVRSTLDAVCELTSLVCHRIGKESYGRRFGDPFKDLVRELHRYLNADLARLPKNERGETEGTRKSAFAGQLRSEAAFALLASLGITKDEVRQWLGT